MDPYAFCGCRECPFKNTLDPRYFFTTEQHEEAVSRIALAIEDHRGMALLQGEAGTGKSLVSQIVLSQLDPARYGVALIVEPDRRMTGTTLLAMLVAELGLEPQRYMLNLKRRLHEYMLAQWRRQRRTVLLIDEAHLCSSSALETVRVLLNLETPQEKLATIVLFAQPEIRGKLNRMPQLDQRIEFRLVLAALTREQCHAYVRHRMKVAGARRAVFAPQALDLLYRYTNIPRSINIVCDHALLVAAAAGVTRVTAALMDRAIIESRGGEPWA